MKLLLARPDIDLYARDERENSALRYAVNAGQDGVVYLLLSETVRRIRKARTMEGQEWNTGYHLLAFVW